MPGTHAWGTLPGPAGELGRAWSHAHKASEADPRPSASGPCQAVGMFEVLCALLSLALITTVIITSYTY